MTQIVRNFAFSTPSLSHGEHGKGSHFDIGLSRPKKGSSQQRILPQGRWLLHHHLPPGLPKACTLSISSSFPSTRVHIAHDTIAEIDWWGIVGIRPVSPSNSWPTSWWFTLFAYELNAQLESSLPGSNVVHFVSSVVWACLSSSHSVSHKLEVGLGIISSWTLFFLSVKISRFVPASAWSGLKINDWLDVVDHTPTSTKDFDQAGWPVI